MARRAHLLAALVRTLFGFARFALAVEIPLPNSRFFLSHGVVSFGGAVCGIVRMSLSSGPNKLSMVSAR